MKLFIKYMADKVITVWNRVHENSVQFIICPLLTVSLYKTSPEGSRLQWSYRDLPGCPESYTVNARGCIILVDAYSFRVTLKSSRQLDNLYHL